MEIDIVEEGNAALMSQTLKKKIRRHVRQMWTDEAGFYDHIEGVLQMARCYNHIEHDLKPNNRLVLTFKNIHIETPEERREALRKKLRAAIATKKHAPANLDPQEQMHQKLCRLLPQEQQAVIPTPAQVRANPDVYRSMMTVLPHQNPVRQYLASFFP